MSVSARDLQRLGELRRRRAALMVEHDEVSELIAKLEKELGVDEWSVPEDVLDKLLASGWRRSPPAKKKDKREMLKQIVQNNKPVEKVLLPLKTIKEDLIVKFGIQPSTAPLKVFLQFPNKVISNRVLELEGFGKRESFMLLDAEQAKLTPVKYRQALKKLGI